MLHKTHKSGGNTRLGGSETNMALKFTGLCTQSTKNTTSITCYLQKKTSKLPGGSLSHPAGAGQVVMRQRPRGVTIFIAETRDKLEGAKTFLGAHCFVQPKTGQTKKKMHSAIRNMSQNGLTESGMHQKCSVRHGNTSWVHQLGDGGS